jgi:hypothetical protein
MGGILFIDEAYYLYKPDNERDYGSEAIEILLQIMENQRDDIIIIFAGYKERMDKFYESNPGLSSRISNHVDFPDYSTSELLIIGKNMLESQQYRMTLQAQENLRNYIQRHKYMPNFSNARNVNNIIDRIRMTQANRTFNSEGIYLTKSNLATLSLEDWESNPLRLNLSLLLEKIVYSNKTINQRGVNIMLNQKIVNIMLGGKGLFMSNLEEGTSDPIKGTSDPTKGTSDPTNNENLKETTQPKVEESTKIPQAVEKTGPFKRLNNFITNFKEKIFKKKNLQSESLTTTADIKKPEKQVEIISRKERVMRFIKKLWPFGNGKKPADEPKVVVDTNARPLPDSYYPPVPKTSDSVGETDSESIGETDLSKSAADSNDPSRNPNRKDVE